MRRLYDRPDYFWEKESFWVWIICGPMFAAIAVAVLFFGYLIANDPNPVTDSDRLNTLQQDRFSYERERDNTQRQMQNRETINKIQSGYYD